MNQMHGAAVVAWGAAIMAAVGCARPLPADPPPNLARAAELRRTLLEGAEHGVAATPAATASTGWATLRGAFRVTENPPSPARVEITKDIDACTSNPAALVSEELLVDATSQGLANVIIFARKVSRVHDDARRVESPQIDYDQQSCRFLSHVLGMRVGQALRLLNSDPVGHNTRVTSPVGPNNINVTIPAGQATPPLYAPKRGENQPVPVNCSIHPWMQAWLLIREDGYFDVTKPDGTFEISNLPSGEDIELQVWHERATNGVVLDRPDLKWTSRGRFTINLREDEVRELELTVPLSALGY